MPPPTTTTRAWVGSGMGRLLRAAAAVPAAAGHARRASVARCPPRGIPDPRAGTRPRRRGGSAKSRLFPPNPMFKNLSVYRLGPDGPASMAQVQDALERDRFVECARTQPLSAGWVEPR